MGEQHARRLRAHAAAVFVAMLAGVLGPAGYGGEPVALAGPHPLLPQAVAPPASVAPVGPAQAQPPADPAFPPLPANAGAGRRIVYGNAEQRVWLVEEDGRVANSYLVSGHDNFPKPATYSVYSKSRHSRAGSVTMEFMVRFTVARGKAVGFHSIPVYRSGRAIQPEGDLGKAVGRGCVRQRLADAAYLWDWASEGTPVVVTP